MIALVRPDTLDNLKETRIAFKGGRVQAEPIQDVADSPEPARWIFHGHTPNSSVDLGAFAQEQLGEGRTILTCDARDQRLPGRHAPLSLIMGRREAPQFSPH